MGTEPLSSLSREGDTVTGSILENSLEDLSYLELWELRAFECPDQLFKK